MLLVWIIRRASTLPKISDVSATTVAFFAVVTAESSKSSYTWESRKTPSSLFVTSWASCRILTASLIHRVVRSDSQPITVVSSQSMMQFSVLLTWSVIAYSLCSDSDCFLVFLVYFLPSCNSSAGKRRQLSARNLIGQHGGSGRSSKSDRKPKTS